jgi:hypothetical protein
VRYRTLNNDRLPLGTLPGNGRRVLTARLPQQENATLNSVMIAMVACGCTFSASLVAIYIRTRMRFRRVSCSAESLLRTSSGPGQRTAAAPQDMRCSRYKGIGP